ncbi:hypothetical protein Vadar_028796 [Vaccinium darrowii]|uniref:Uncharacterized protein n=1 Tax=Vaccinium darrowii TaxID=229202 RepID=A0ACB7Y2X9_9ERIC|nr:hypothetical protein Vadar_028796 [Vaccinium darrowii]
MELLYDFLLSFFLLLVIYLSHHFLLSYKNRKAGGNEKQLPGKTGFPVIGESLEFISTGWKGHPEKFIFDRIAKYSSDVFKTSLGGSPMVVFGGSNGNKFLFSNENKLVQVSFLKSVDKIFPSSTRTTSNQEAFMLRKMLRNILKPAAFQSYIAMMDNVAHRHFVADWERRDTVVVFPLTKSYTIWLGFHLFLSIEDPNHVALLEKHFEVLGGGILSVPIDLPGTPLNRAIKASNFITKELVVIIKQRKKDLAEGKASPTQDILSHMLLMSDDDNGKFRDEDDIADKILGLLVGGHDTVSPFVLPLSSILLSCLRSTKEFTKSNWILRNRNLQGTFREAITDFMYNGFSIKKGWKIYWSVSSTHKNHKFFPEPQKFDPSRFEGSEPAPYTFAPFGGGPRMCPGNEYARLAILVFMHHLVKRFRWEKLIPDEKLIYDPLAKPEKDLPIRLFPHETY